jgi:hypothetical protein
MNKSPSSLAILSLIFLCGLCDRTSNLEYLIENGTDTNIEVKLYGLSSPFGNVKRDSIKTLAIGESFIIYSEEQMGQVSKTRQDSIIFFDSLVCKRLDNNYRTIKNFKILEEWNYSEIEDYLGEYRLRINNVDF